MVCEQTHCLMRHIMVKEYVRDLDAVGGEKDRREYSTRMFMLDTRQIRAGIYTKEDFVRLLQPVD